MTTIELLQPDDWHVHLRDDEMLAAVVGYSAQRFRYSMVMPNLMPPIISSETAAKYRAKILSHAPETQSGFNPQMAIYCSDKVNLDDLKAGIDSGAIAAVKYYPAGATTNSAAGGQSMVDFMALYEVLAECGVRLLVHAESTDPTIDLFDREAVFLERQLATVCDRLPELQVTVEHVSTAAGIDFVAAHDQAVATITPHHLSKERSDLLAHGMKPDLFCKPIINSAADRDALVAAATSGGSSFFLGTDSAPHPTTAKYGPTAKAGIFNAAYGLEVVAEVFYQQNKLEKLEAFTSRNGAEAYGVAVADTRIRLTREAVDTEIATSFTTTAGDEVVLFGTDEAALWKVEQLPGDS